MTTWLSDGGCGKCNSCGMDMDLEPFCVNEDVLTLRTAETGRDYPWGLDIGVARPLCKGDHWVERGTAESKPKPVDDALDAVQHSLHF